MSTYVERPTAPIASAANFASQAQSETVRSGVSQIAQNAAAFAGRILQGEGPAGGSNRVDVHHHYGYSPYWWFMPYSSPSVVYVGPGADRARRSEEESGQRVLIGVIAMVVGAIALFATGSAIGRCQEASHDLEDSELAKDKLNRYQREAPAGDQALVNEARLATELKARVCKRIKDSAIIDLALRVGLLAGCGLLLAGAFATFPAAFLLAGAVTSFTAGGAMLFKWGFETTDKQNSRDALAIRDSVRRLATL